MYATPAHLLDGPEAAKELGELYGCDPLLLVAVEGGGDTSAWTGDEVAAATAALNSITTYCEQAAAEVDTRLATRGYATPLSAVQFPILAVWSRAIARYHLNRNRDKTDEERGRIERDYRDALRFLDMIAAGKLSLGADDPLTGAAGDGAVQIASNRRLFDRRSLRGL